LLRLTLNAGLTESEIAHIERTARDAALVLKPWEWAAARRQRNRSSD
jgi:hypothetical protein